MPKKVGNFGQVERNEAIYCSECGHELTIYETDICDVCLLEQKAKAGELE